MAAYKPQLILASASPRRQDLLQQMGLQPSKIIPADIDETPFPDEQPEHHVRRLALEKARAVNALPDVQGCFLIAADTIVVMGRRILGKAQSTDEAHTFLKQLSGRRHRVISGVAVINPQGKTSVKSVTSVVRFKTLSHDEISTYIESGDWQGKAGAYGIQGFAGCFVQQIKGSYPNIVGLPLFETKNMLEGLGFPVLTTIREGQIT